MNSKDFNVIINERCALIKQVLAKKATEYASGEDRFHNFNVAARKRNTSPEQALMGVKVKHDVSVDDLVEWAENAPEKLTLDLINEKIGDSINYLCLLEGMLKRRVEVCARTSHTFYGVVAEKKMSDSHKFDYIHELMEENGKIICREKKKYFKFPGEGE